MWAGGPAGAVATFTDHGCHASTIAPEKIIKKAVAIIRIDLNFAVDDIRIAPFEKVIAAADADAGDIDAATTAAANAAGMGTTAIWAKSLSSNSRGLLKPRAASAFRSRWRARCTRLPAAASVIPNE
jgi:hypothetical protein